MKPLYKTLLVLTPLFAFPVNLKATTPLPSQNSLKSDELSYDSAEEAEGTYRPESASIDPDIIFYNNEESDSDNDSENDLFDLNDDILSKQPSQKTNNIIHSTSQSSRFADTNSEMPEDTSAGLTSRISNTKQNNNEENTQLFERIHRIKALPTMRAIEKLEASLYIDPQNVPSTLYYARVLNDYYNAQRKNKLAKIKSILLTNLIKLLAMNTQKLKFEKKEDYLNRQREELKRIMIILGPVNDYKEIYATALSLKGVDDASAADLFLSLALKMNIQQQKSYDPNDLIMNAVAQFTELASSYDNNHAYLILNTLYNLKIEYVGEAQYQLLIKGQPVDHNLKLYAKILRTDRYDLMHKIGKYMINNYNEKYGIEFLKVASESQNPDIIYLLGKTLIKSSKLDKKQEGMSYLRTLALTYQHNEARKLLIQHLIHDSWAIRNLQVLLAPNPCAEKYMKKKAEIKLAAIKQNKTPPQNIQEEVARSITLRGEMMRARIAYQENACDFYFHATEDNPESWQLAYLAAYFASQGPRSKRDAHKALMFYQRALNLNDNILNFNDGLSLSQLRKKARSKWR